MGWGYVWKLNLMCLKQTVRRKILETGTGTETNVWNKWAGRKWFGFLSLRTKTISVRCLRDSEVSISVECEELFSISWRIFCREWLSSYLKGNKLRLDYKSQSGNAREWNNFCFFGEMYETLNLIFGQKPTFAYHVVVTCTYYCEINGFFIVVWTFLSRPDISQ